VGKIKMFKLCYKGSVAMSTNMRSYEAESTQLLNDLQALDFALVELTLYLDKHPYDEKAIKRHNVLAEQRHATRDKLENHPEDTRTPEANDSNGCRWSLSPWPWQI
jgi:spore coat protein JB